MSTLNDKIYGCLLGGLIGDAMGAPVEGKRYSDILAQYGPEGVTDFEGEGTDDTAIREQLISAILAAEGYPTVDDFAQSFSDFKEKNRDKWYIPVRNAFYKYEEGLSLPAYAGWGNMQSSSTAMAFSPLGIINACNPRRAVLEALHIGSFVHNGPSGFCRDGAAAICAAVAEAFKSGAAVESITKASTQYLPAMSAHEMIGSISQALNLAQKTGSYERFRESYYAKNLRAVISDSRETVPAVLAIFSLAKGDPKKSILLGANFGRDADTIGTMIGGLAGALHGASGLPPEWVAKVEANPNVDYQKTADRLTGLVRKRAADSSQLADLISELQ